MKIFLEFIIVLCLFTACSKNKEIEDPSQPEQPSHRETYDYQSIDFILDNQSVSTNDSLLVIQREYQNNTLAVLTSTIDIPTQSETSRFSGNTEVSFAYTGNELHKVSVPILINSGKIFMGESIWKYSENKTEALPQVLSDQHITLPVQPKTKVALEVYAKWQNLSTSYLATYKGKTTGKILKVKGIWTGKQLKGFSTKIHAENIK